MHGSINWLIVTISAIGAGLVAAKPLVDLLKMLKDVSPVARRLLRACALAGSGVWRRLAPSRRLANARLRARVVIGGPEELLEAARRAHERGGRRDAAAATVLAKALAFFGRIDFAISTDPVGAAVGFACAGEHHRAVALLEPRRHSDVLASYMWEALVDKYPSSTSEQFNWRRRATCIIPTSEIADELADVGMLTRCLSCLPDVAEYLKSKRLSNGRNIRMLRLMDAQRLSALRRIVVRISPSHSLPAVAANLAILMRARVEFGNQPA